MLFSSALLNCKLQCVCKIKTSWQFYMQNDTRGGLLHSPRQDFENHTVMAEEERAKISGTWKEGRTRSDDGGD